MMKLTRGNTWIHPEELAYPGGSLRQSRRFGLVRCPDGTLRRVKLGIPDTFFSIPAVCRAYGKTVAGFVMLDSEMGEFLFSPYLYRKNHHVFSRKEKTQ